MRKSELRQKLFDFFEEKEIDYDQSQNTMNLYRWAVRNHSFKPVEEIEQEIEAKKAEKKKREQEQVNAEKEQEKKEDEENERLAAEKQAKKDAEEKERQKEEKKERKKEEKKDPDPVKVEVVKESEIKKEEQSKNDWIFYLLILAFVAYLLFNFLKNKENADTEEPGE